MSWNWNGQKWDPKREGLSWLLFLLGPAVVMMIIAMLLPIPGMRFIVEHPLVFVFVAAVIVVVGIIVIFRHGKQDTQNKDQSDT